MSMHSVDKVMPKDSVVNVGKKTSSTRQQKAKDDNEFDNMIESNDQTPDSRGDSVSLEKGESQSSQNQEESQTSTEQNVASDKGESEQTEVSTETESVETVSHIEEQTAFVQEIISELEEAQNIKEELVHLTQNTQVVNENQNTGKQLQAEASLEVGEALGDQIEGNDQLASLTNQNDDLLNEDLEASLDIEKALNVQNEESDESAELRRPILIDKSSTPLNKTINETLTLEQENLIKAKLEANHDLVRSLRAPQGADNMSSVQDGSQNIKMNSAQSITKAQAGSEILKASDIEPERLLNQIKDALGSSMEAKKNRVEIKLDPPQWGKVEIRMEMKRSEVKVMFMTEHLAVKEELSRHLSLMRQSFVGEGASLGQVHVGWMGDHAASQFGYEFDGEAMDHNDAKADNNADEEKTEPTRVKDIHASMVDRVV